VELAPQPCPKYVRRVSAKCPPAGTELTTLKSGAGSRRWHPFAAIIPCTADPAKANKRTRSKWSRVMRYAAVYKPGSEALEKFIRRKGGINACAARFSRWIG
jgi:hypothetical protein